MAALGEFGRINAILAPLTADHPEARGLADDAALVAPDLVVTTDAIVEGVDFFADDPPDLIARKLLRINLSDLAAMGAVAESYLLTAILPSRCDDDWLTCFAAGLAEDQQTFGLRLIGGDSGSTPGPITLSATMLGRAPAAGVVGRRGAMAGDLVFVSGTIGDSALGLAMLMGRLKVADADHRSALADRYRLPRPRIALGCALAGQATAMIDVSDGLVADLDHICEASGLTATIKAMRVPLSEAAAALFARDGALLGQILTGGDDYELLFTAPEAAVPSIERLAQESGVAVRPIGRMSDHAGRPRAIVQDGAGQILHFERTGWRHD